MRCGDCKHWKRVDEEVEDADGDYAGTKPTDFGTCERVKGEAMLAPNDGRIRGVGQDWREIVGDRDAVPCDGSGYHAALLTRDRFGCVLYELRSK